MIALGKAQEPVNKRVYRLWRSLKDRSSSYMYVTTLGRKLLGTVFEVIVGGCLLRMISRFATWR